MTTTTTTRDTATATDRPALLRSLATATRLLATTILFPALGCAMEAATEADIAEAENEARLEEEEEENANQTSEDDLTYKGWSCAAPVIGTVGAGAATALLCTFGEVLTLGADTAECVGGLAGTVALSGDAASNCSHSTKKKDNTKHPAIQGRFDFHVLKANHACVFADYYFGGQMRCAAIGGCNNTQIGVDSAVAGKNAKIILYKNANCTGPSKTVTRNNNLAEGDWHNATRSMKVVAR